MHCHLVEIERCGGPLTANEAKIVIASLRIAYSVAQGFLGSIFLVVSKSKTTTATTTTAATATTTAAATATTAAAATIVTLLQQ